MTDIPIMDRRTIRSKSKLQSQQLLVKFASPQSPAVTTHSCARCTHGIVQTPPTFHDTFLDPVGQGRTQADNDLQHSSNEVPVERNM